MADLPGRRPRSPFAPDSPVLRRLARSLSVSPKLAIDVQEFLHSAKLPLLAVVLLVLSFLWGLGTRVTSQDDPHQVQGQAGWAAEIEKNTTEQDPSTVEKWSPGTSPGNNSASLPASGRSKKQGMNVAVCLFGRGSEFELTGPSIISRLLTAYPGTHLFINTPLDESSYKLHALAWAPHNVTVAAFRVFPNTWVDENAYPEILLRNGSSFGGAQSIFQHMRLVEGCKTLIEEYEDAYDFRFNWTLSTGLDTFWAKAPPPLRGLATDEYTVPHGSDREGVNDRLGMGTWKTSQAALSRLSTLREINSTWKDVTLLNSEQALQKQLELANIKVAREHFSFCAVSRNKYFEDTVPVASMASLSPLNGAECRPCKPTLAGPKAEKRLKLYPAAVSLGPAVAGVDLCTAQRDWDAGWEDEFEAAVGPSLARQRRRIVEVSLGKCVAHFDQLRRRVATWDAPGSLALCLRHLQGPGQMYGPEGASFEILEPYKRGGKEVLLASGSSKPADDDFYFSFQPWLSALKTKEDAEVEHVHLPQEERRHTSEPEGSGALEGEILALNVSASVLEQTLSGWVELGERLHVCQVLVAFPPPEDSQSSHRDKVSDVLGILYYQLNSCIMEPGSQAERCTYFSTVDCPSERQP